MEERRADAGRDFVDHAERDRRAVSHELLRPLPVARPDRGRSMTVHVRLFAGLRERAGWSEREVEAATVADVWAALDLGDEPAGLLYAVNKEYASPDRALADGDE